MFEHEVHGSKPAGPLFEDRRAAGKLLGRELQRFRNEKPLIVALPRGGVVVAEEVARALDAPLDVCVVRKIGAPSQPELGIGAVAEGGDVFVSPLSARLGIEHDELVAMIAAKSAEVKQRAAAFRRSARAIDVKGRTVIVVDDGVATGGTAAVALDSLRKRGAGRLVLAVPVGAVSTLDELARYADEIVCPAPLEILRAVGLWYDDFSTVTTDQVIEILDRARATVRIDASGVTLAGELVVPEHARGVVLFAHGSGSSRRSPRDRFVAAALNRAGLATLLFDLLTPDEERLDARTAHLRFDTRLLADRLVGATDWVSKEPSTQALPIGYFGASAGAGAALIAAVERPQLVRALVSRGGRPDLAGPVLSRVHAPTLLLVGGDDDTVLGLNREALAWLGGDKQLDIVPSASQLFDEPGALEHVARAASSWFVRHFAPAPADASV
jgi:putative phosphoribosyl transferase